MITIQTEIDLPKEIDRKLLRKAISTTLNFLENTDLDITLRLTNDQEIHQLNQIYRKIDKPTDVLSFNYNFVDPETERCYLGDIIISIETAARQAPDHGLSINQELVFLAIHGTLHLLGYDHHDPDQEKAMFDLQDKIFDIVNATIMEK